MNSHDEPRAGGFDRGALLEALDELIAHLERIPGAARFRGDVDQLKQILLEKRPPRVAVLGRRGAGKSSLANAILGARQHRVSAVEDQPAPDEWTLLEAGGRQLEWLDTSGIGAGGVEDRREKLTQQMLHRQPDTILLACKAEDVDAQIDATLEDFRLIISTLGTGEKAPRVIVVLTQCDKLDPPTEDRTVPYSEERMGYIRAATEVLAGHLSRLGINHHAIVAVSAAMGFNRDGDLTSDYRYNIENLEKAIFEVLPLNAQLEAARLFERFRGARRALAMKLVALASSVSFGIGFLPIPGSDIVPLYSLQATLVTAIAYLSGRKLGAKAVGEWVAALGVGAGVGIALREAFRQVLKFVPVAGDAAAAGLAAAGTFSLGRSAIAYFLDDRSLAEAKATFEAGQSREWKSENDAPPEA